MARPWQTLASIDTPEGALELRQRGPKDFLIVVGGRVLMSSVAHRSELDVAEAACAQLKAAAPRVLIGGLGMGYTLRAALDALPATAHVAVAELNPVVERWCRGPMALLTDDALGDPRSAVIIDDVAAVIRRAAAAKDDAARWDAIVLDLYEGPHEASQAKDDPFYGRKALDHTRRALRPGGVFSVWSEEPDAAFERRLKSAGFTFELRRPGKGGRRHAVYLATVGAAAGRAPDRKADRGRR